MPSLSETQFLPNETMSLRDLDIPRKPHLRLVDGNWKVVNDSGFQARFRYPHENKKFLKANAWCRYANYLAFYAKQTKQELISELLELKCGDQS